MINSIKYENRINIAKIDNIKRNISIQQTVLEERQKIIDTRKEKIPKTFLFKKKQEQVRFQTAQSEFKRITDENDKMKEEIKKIYNEISQQVLPPSQYSNVDIKIMQSSIDFFQNSVETKRKFVFHVEEILSFTTYKLNKLREMEKLYKSTIDSLKDTSKTLNKRKIEAYSKTIQVIPALQSIESIVFDLEGDVDLLVKKYNSTSIEQSPRKAIVEILVNQNKERREILVHRKKLLDEQIKSYKSPQIQKISKFQPSPKKPIINLESNFDQIKEKVHNRLDELKKNTIAIETETDDLQAKFLENRKEIEQKLHKKYEKIKDINAQIKQNNEMLIDISYYHEMIEELKENFNDLQSYKKKLENKLTVPSITLISPRNHTKLGRIASKRRIIENNEKRLSRLRKYVYNLQQEVKRKEAEFDAANNESKDLISI